MGLLQRLYHREGAGRPRRVRWALEEAGATYEYVVMDKEEGQRPRARQTAPARARAGARNRRGAALRVGRALHPHRRLAPRRAPDPAAGHARPRPRLPVGVLHDDRARARRDTALVGAPRRRSRRARDGGAAHREGRGGARARARGPRVPRRRQLHASPTSSSAACSTAPATTRSTRTRRRSSPIWSVSMPGPPSSGPTPRSGRLPKR